MARKLPTEVALSEAARRLPALVRRLSASPGERIALTVRGQVRAWLVAAPPGGNDADAETPASVERLVKRALKAARQ